jgi:pimeloyl-ACP methyl ester carboxylesterase
MNKIEMIIAGSKDKNISLDISYKKNNVIKPVVLFIHGFKGFKDWGHFNLIATYFAAQDFVFVKMNTSYNGTTSEFLQDFVELESFGLNNFLLELEDIKLVLDFIEDKIHHYEGNQHQISIIGHSRGGGLSILTAFQDARVRKLVTWASIASFQYFFDGIDIAKWKDEGVIYTFNSRTNQNMPLYFQLYENYMKYKNELNVEHAAHQLGKPWLIIHGKNDESVKFEAAIQLHTCNKKSEILLIENTNHTFGGKHPFAATDLPKESKIAIDASLVFLKL